MSYDFTMMPDGTKTLHDLSKMVKEQPEINTDVVVDEILRLYKDNPAKPSEGPKPTTDRAPVPVPDM